jgi:hypothetical protein
MPLHPYRAHIMKTAVIKGTVPGAFDQALLASLKMTDTPDWSVRNETYLLGMLNERGEIYRLVGVEDLRSFVTMLNKLRSLRYTTEIADGDDAEHGFDTIAVAPHERSGDTHVSAGMPGTARHSEDRPH